MLRRQTIVDGKHPTGGSAADVCNQAAMGNQRSDDVPTPMQVKHRISRCAPAMAEFAGDSPRAHRFAQPVVARRERATQRLVAFSHLRDTAIATAFTKMLRQKPLKHLDLFVHLESQQSASFWSCT